MSEKDNMNHNELENEVEKVDDKDVVVEDQKKDDDEYERYASSVTDRKARPAR